MYTKRDAQIVRWIGGVGAASPEHVMGRFAMGRSWAYERLKQLVDTGLLVHRPLLHDRPGLYVASTEGLRSVHLQRLGVYRLGPGKFEHAWQVASVAVRLHLGLPGWSVLGERELRLREHDEGQLLASVSLGDLPGGRQALHRPDLVLISPQGGVWAVEVELSVKAPRRLQGICRGWARARYLEGVCYLAAPGPLRALERALIAVRAQDRVTVMALEHADLFAQTLRGEPR